MNRVEPALLRWACERSGRPEDYFRHRFPKLDAWERGTVLPALKQLEGFAKATYTPIGFLFLKEPPVEELPVTDLRTVRGVEVGRHPPAYRVDVSACPGVLRLVARALQNCQQTRRRPHPGHLCGSSRTYGLREVESSAGERAPTPRPLVDTGSP